MNIKETVKKSSLLFSLRCAFELCKEFRIYKHWLSNYAKKSDVREMKTDLSIRTHALEKGMSIGTVKIGFGKPKAISLLQDLHLYIKKGGDMDFVSESCSVINKYIEFNKSQGVDMSDVEGNLLTLVNEYKINLIEDCGIYSLTHEQISKLALSCFEEFSQSRFSIRDFGTKRIDVENIKKALKLCERTPSACNRQGWRIHIYTDKDLKNTILNLQLGNKGFTDDMQGAILVCGDLRNYGFPEFHLPYVDAGLYAMNLMYALSYYDIASIPLTMAHKQSLVSKQRMVLNLPEYEVPVILIGIGTYKDNFKVAVSHRQKYEQYVTFNE